MPKVTAAIAALLLALTLTGCGEEEQPDSQPVGFAQITEPTETPAPVETAPTAEPSTEEDAAYLAEVLRRQPPNTVLDQLSDDEIVALGHEGCKQIREGVPIEDLRLVDGENGVDPRAWADTSAVFNSALLNYCPELMEYVD